MDWDKLRIFHAAAEAGSFTHAGETLAISQSAVSRHIASLERDLNVPLFHRHARGLVLTEQGELLYRTAQEVFSKLATTQILLADSRGKPNGQLKVTTTMALGTGWLTPRLNEFMKLYPDIQLQLILDDETLNLTMREADVAIWFGPPSQQDFVRRKLFTVHFHVYASVDYVKRNGRPRNLEDLDRHRILTYGGVLPSPFKEMNWLETAGRDGRDLRDPSVRINSLLALREAVLQGVGIAVLPDYLAKDHPRLVNVLEEAEMPIFDTYFVYPADLKDTKRVNAFRDFLVEKSREWSF
ncbi:LysR family transcriptional regulator [Rhodomicrobium udaipurense JA643]|uniref:LysR family transcriptional regulator n=1 Tax=Rhodomicrobium udaipurense TaxID=1202716 RepID=A0A8I1GH92_9HYPH|nr:LysR family transcriptional regulator [Rhodomicrobium udaipurense]KAI95140.1 LysR family transcriptional regulator [Rhodomicrobium udaipurense JA643]MBJ7543916.1 LysR family transcriptional regulator [Rhodomicrobium udaipurense]